VSKNKSTLTPFQSATIRTWWNSGGGNSCVLRAPVSSGRPSWRGRLGDLWVQSQREMWDSVTSLLRKKLAGWSKNKLFVFKIAPGVIITWWTIDSRTRAWH